MAPILQEAYFIREKQNSEEIYGVLKIGSQSRHSKEIDVERNHAEGSLETYSPHFTETKIRWAPMGKYERLQLTLPLKKFQRCTAGEE